MWTSSIHVIISHTPERLKKYDVFGWRALITGSPYSYSAFARINTTLLVLPRHAFEILNLNSSEARQKVHLMLRSEDILSYLQRDQGLTQQQAEEWLESCNQSAWSAVAWFHRPSGYGATGILFAINLSTCSISR